MYWEWITTLEFKIFVYLTKANYVISIMYVNVVISRYVCTSGMLEGERQGAGRTPPRFRPCPYCSPSRFLAPGYNSPQIFRPCKMYVFSSRYLIFKMHLMYRTRNVLARVKVGLYKNQVSIYSLSLVNFLTGEKQFNLIFCWRCSFFYSLEYRWVTYVIFLDK